MLDELERHCCIAWPVPRQRDSGLEHLLAEERHPGAGVGLCEVGAGRQRRAPVEDPDTVQPQEAALEDFSAGKVFAVYPPGEVEQQLLEAVLDPGEIPL